MSGVATSKSSPANESTLVGKWRGPSKGVAVVTASVGVACMVVSGLLFFATGAVSSAGAPDSRAMISSGMRGASLVEWACFIDMFGYLLLAVLVLYLRQRFHDVGLIDLYSVAGLASVLIGALGAAMFATAGPALIREYAAASASQRYALTTTLSTLNQIVSIGLWQILEGIPAGVWLVGIGTSLYHTGRRRLSLCAFVLGGLLLLLAATRILGD